MKDFETFFDAYVEAALFSSTDNADDSGGDPLDKNYGASDIAPDTLSKMKHDCSKFLFEYAALLDEVEPSYKGCPKYAYAGHDFWLTRCGHGCGFWDGDWPEPQAAKLTDACKTFGNFDLYVGDDGLIYGS